MSNRGKRYNREFKLQAARLVVENGYSCNEVSKRLGVSDYSVGKWVKQFRDEGTLATSGKSLSASEELKAARQQIRRLKQENEILKKATAYFARETDL